LWQEERQLAAGWGVAISFCYCLKRHPGRRRNCVGRGRSQSGTGRAGITPKQLKNLLNRDGTDTLATIPNGIHAGLRREKCHGMFFFQAPGSGDGKRLFY
jgi:hypothetical protein